MMNQISIPVAPPRRSAPTGWLAPMATGRGVRRIRRAWFSPALVPSLEEAEGRMRSHAGFIASLTPEDSAFLRAYEGRELSGSQDVLRRAF
jgi:hypothetical protein